MADVSAPLPPTSIAPLPLISSTICFSFVDVSCLRAVSPLAGDTCNGCRSGLSFSAEMSLSVSSVGNTVLPRSPTMSSGPFSPAIKKSALFVVPTAYAAVLLAISSGPFSPATNTFSALVVPFAFPGIVPFVTMLYVNVAVLSGGFQLSTSAEFNS